MAWLKSFSLRPSQALALGCASALATTLVIGAALGSGPVPSAVIAALHHRVVVRVSPRRATPRAAAPIASGGASPTGAASAATSSPSSAATSASSSAGSGASSSASSAASTATSTTSTTTSPAAAKPKVKHVFVIALSTSGYVATWGRGSVAHYLNRTLRPRGTLLSGYRTLGRAELPDYLAMISGQAPNADTQTNCLTYAEFGSKATPDKAGQMRGAGCVYPSTVQTIGDQVTATGKRWKAYVDGLGSSTCVHPNSDAVDNAVLPGAGSDYATRHNPFIYFHSLLDLGDCGNDDVALAHLTKDLRSAKRTPAYSFIAPSLCADVSALGCAAGQTSGLAAEDAFLKLWVPRILASAAYRKDGALMIVFAAGGTRPTSDTTTTTTTSTTTSTSTSTTASTSPSAATTPASASASTLPAVAAGSAPDRVGALILSRFGRRGKTISASYNPYSVLRSTEQLLGYSSLVRAKHAASFVAQALPNG